MAENLIYRLPNEVIDYTEEQVAEVFKCKNDISYFAETYCKIITPKGRQNIELYDYQKEFLDDSIDHLRYILRCSRQVGKTTISTILICWYILFSGSDRNVAVVSKDLAGAKEILKRVKITYGELPKWLQRGVVDWNITNIMLDNETSVTCFPAGSEQLRGFSVNLLYLDEFAILKKTVANDFIDTVMPTIANDPEARIVITSTPKGKNQFYDMWKLALDECNIEQRAEYYKRKIVKWDAIPRLPNPAKWKAKMIRDLKGDEERFNQEFEVKFDIGGSQSFFKSINLEENNTYTEFWKKRKHVICKIWKRPQRLFSDAQIRNDLFYYVAGVDVSEGIEGDSTVCTLFEIDKRTLTWTQIGRFTTNVIDPKDVHLELHTIFKDIMNERIDKIFIENNSFGRQVITGLIDEHPEEFYEERIYKGEVGVGKKKKKKLGVQTNTKTKPDNVRELNYIQTKAKLILQDNYTATEFGNFVKDGNRFYGIDGHPDDEVMSVVVQMELLKTHEYKEFVLAVKTGKITANTNKYNVYDEEEDVELIVVNGRKKKFNPNAFAKYQSY